MKTKIKSAFTLLELLIVIAIIAILVSIALPVLKKVKTLKGDGQSQYHQTHDYSKD